MLNEHAFGTCTMSVQQYWYKKMANLKIKIKPSKGNTSTGLDALSILSYITLSNLFR